MALLSRATFYQVPEGGPVFDDCAEIREKIRAFLASGRMTKTGFLKELKVNSNSLRRFMEYEGLTRGASGRLYPAAYRFFESLRILEGRPKTMHRVGAEVVFPNGRPLECRRGYIVEKGNTIVENEWGQPIEVPDIWREDSDSEEDDEEDEEEEDEEEDDY